MVTLFEEIETGPYGATAMHVSIELRRTLPYTGSDQLYFDQFVINIKFWSNGTGPFDPTHLGMSAGERIAALRRHLESSPGSENISIFEIKSTSTSENGLR